MRENETTDLCFPRHSNHDLDQYLHMAWWLLLNWLLKSWRGVAGLGSLSQKLQRQAARPEACPPYRSSTTRKARPSTVIQQHSSGNFCCFLCCSQMCNICLTSVSGQCLCGAECSSRPWRHATAPASPLAEHPFLWALG
eukprot:1162042-Pelagomonas_calceolata.AAC.2